MNKSRLEAFSDGVLAIIITIMVLELKIPEGHEWSDLRTLWPKFLAYAISFIYVGIYWNNHHHMMHTVRRVNGTILWANLHLLFWLSLFPFVSGWAGESHFAANPMTSYGFVALMCGAAYTLLVVAIVRADPQNNLLEQATGGASDRKGILSVAAYVIATVSPFFGQAGVILSGVMLIGVALMWLIPDKRIERILEQAEIRRTKN
ncbi:TMEM175 family protein [Deinococcus sp. KNUC1210]|uniref:TMEM175 family protein n=1 Tax=Deinococcus sp. KNUC1210 TaxID=2917691 RepID=UPI001EF0F58A|nr:TMEM175 family protein [Deinococcus sp. KNUC1210]ULH15569.1 TMEM175 family protein [Deinococcus sp. KNUC1210]